MGLTMMSLVRKNCVNEIFVGVIRLKPGFKVAAPNEFRFPKLTFTFPKMCQTKISENLVSREILKSLILKFRVVWSRW
jgi:hypothetical protein